ncbi:MAG: tRNA (guanosine(46)-N7)-methyltransferase TrmB [Burkholderiaceae bacterium]
MTSEPASEAPIQNQRPDNQGDKPYMRVIKSYVLRGAQARQARAFEQFGPKYLLSYQASPLDVAAAFGRTAPLYMEIGFGMGGATAHIAQVRPEDNFICCEVHEPGVGSLLKLIGEGGIENIRIFRHDAVEVLDHMLGEGSLDGVHIFFPDPWHKSRHHKRRLIQGPFVNRLARHVKPGGICISQPTGNPMPEQMHQVLEAEPLLVNSDTQPGPHGCTTKPDYRPLTKFENRGIKLGHGVWDLVYRRV